MEQHGMAGLTNAKIEKLKAKGKTYQESIGNGLSIQIRTNGTKMWLFNYSRPYGKASEKGRKARTNISFGVFPVVDLEEAKELHLNARKQLRSGIDPKIERDKDSNEDTETLEYVFEKWIEVKSDGRTKKYIHDIRASIETHILPSIGRYPIRKIEAPMVVSVLQPLADVNKRELVRRISQRLNEVMLFANARGMISHNPLFGVRSQFKTPKIVNLPSVHPRELPAVLARVHKSTITQTVKNLMMFQLSTMVRPGEANGAMWDEFRLDGNPRWILPARRMKRGKRHVVPLTPQVVSLLESQQELNITLKKGNSPYVFPGDRKPNQPINSESCNAALKRSGYKGRLVSHGLRSIASTLLNMEDDENGLPWDSQLIEFALSHLKKDQTEAAYNRGKQLGRRRKLMEFWSGKIEEAKTGKMILKNDDGDE